MYTDSQQKNKHMLEKSFDIVLSIFSRLLESVRKTCRCEFKDRTAWTPVVSCAEISIIKISFSVFITTCRITV